MTPDQTATAESSLHVAPAPIATEQADARESQTRKFRFDSRYIAPIFITCILLVGQITFGVLESYDRTMLAIAAAIGTEIVLSRVFTGKWPHLASAYISGISVGILIRSPEYWPYALCSMIAITSKYAIRWRGRHLWNPSNLGICAMLIIAHESVATLTVQWDNRVWAMLAIWAIGSIIIWNLKRFHICATYALSFVAFAFVRALLVHNDIPLGDRFLQEVAPITGPMYQLFVFFMITDPKTTVQSKSWQCVVAFMVALVETILRLNQNIHAPYYALFLVGPTALFIEMWLNGRKKAEGEESKPDTAKQETNTASIATA